MTDKDVAIINWRTGVVTICSRTQAGREIGTTYQSIWRWIKSKRKFMNHNHHTVLFSVRALKQMKGFAKKKAARINKENFKRFHRC